MAKDTQPVVLFGGGAGGFGDAQDMGRDTYNFSMNWQCGPHGTAAPAPVPTGLGITAGDIPREITSVIEWESATTRPFMLMTGAKVSGGVVFRAVGKVQDGSFTIEDFQAGDPYTDAVLYRHDGSDIDAEAAFFCNGYTKDEIERRLKSGGYTSDGIDDAKADLLAIVGSSLWRVLDGYKLQELTLDTSPGTDSNWGTITPVGRPTWPINMVLDFFGSPLVFKGDGVFTYSDAPSDPHFKPRTPWIDPHKDNGKGGGMDGRGRAYYPTVDGHILVISLGRQSQQGPLRLHSFNRDTPWGPISSITAGPDHVYAAIDPGAIRTQQEGLAVKSYDNSAGAYTDHTSNVT